MIADISDTEQVAEMLELGEGFIDIKHVDLPLPTGGSVTTDISLTLEEVICGIWRPNIEEVRKTGLFSYSAFFEELKRSERPDLREIWRLYWSPEQSHPRAVGRLLGLLEKKESNARSAAMIVLGTLVREARDGLTVERTPLDPVLGEVLLKDSRASQLLAQQLQADDSMLVAASALAIGELCASSAAPALAAALHRLRNKMFVIEGRAAVTIQRMPLDPLVREIKKLEVWISYELLRSLAKLAGDSAIENIIPFLTHPPKLGKRGPIFTPYREDAARALAILFESTPPRASQETLDRTRRAEDILRSLAQDPVPHVDKMPLSAATTIWKRTRKALRRALKAARRYRRKIGKKLGPQDGDP